MTEPKGKYKTEAEQALDMLGVGYDANEPAATVHPPRTVLALDEGGLKDHEVWGWVKISAKFLHHIRRLKGAKLAIWQTIALTINKHGVCGLSIQQIATASGYSRAEAAESLKELEEMGYISVQRENGKRSMYKPNFAARGGKSPSDEPVQKVDTSAKTSPVRKDRYQSSPSLENADSSIKSLKRVNTGTPEFDFENMTVPEAHQVPTIKMFHRATKFFPGAPLWQYVHDFLTKNNVTEDKLRETAILWRASGYRMQNIKGILEAARDGFQQKPQQGAKNKSSEPAPFPTFVDGKPILPGE